MSAESRTAHAVPGQNIAVVVPPHFAPRTLDRLLIQVEPELAVPLCVISWNEENLRPWVAAANPVILGESSAWDDNLTAELNPVVMEAMKGLTRTINHNNTISAGFEKDQVVGVLLALHGAGIPMDADAVEGWSIAHGWSGKNPSRLAKYVRDINDGKRPQSKSAIRPGYIETLRKREAGSGQRHRRPVMGHAAQCWRHEKFLLEYVESG